MKREYVRIYKHCMISSHIDCIKLFNEIADMPKVPMHGPVHHFIVPAVLLTCYNNAVGEKKQLKSQLVEVAKRAKIVPGGNCASCGYCGAAAGVGSFFSIITGNNPLEEQNWSKVMTISATVSSIIAKYGGPRCCKRDGYIALIEGAKEVEKHLGIKLIADKPMCKYFPRNNECLKQNCLFYPKKAS